MLIYSVFVLISFVLGRMGIYTLSGFALILSALYLYYREYEDCKKIINLPGIFYLSFVGGQGISALKLSYLQKDWDPKTWICFYLTVLCFTLSCKVFQRHLELGKRSMDKTLEKSEKKARIFALSTCILCLVSLFSFLAEALILGYIPLFIRGVPHAYSYFHITGLHYFTVSCVLVPAMAVIYFFHYSKEGFKDKKRMDIYVLIAAFTALCIPVLLVSRFQFIFAIIVALVTFLSVKREIKAHIVISAFIIIIPVYVLLSVARSHDIEYLNGIFEMKNAYPIYISQPYIYIANNYDNFNAMVEGIEKHSMGLKMLFPVLALSGLKFVLADFLSFPLFITKTELTTLTLVYDAYYDFGLFGLMIFSCALGALAAKLESIRVSNPVFYLIYAQILLYFLLAFFTTWFSNPATWFYLLISMFIYFITEKRGNNGFGKNGKAS